jgi:hypothetical protein
MTARWLAFLRGHHRPARAEAEHAEAAEEAVRAELTVPLHQFREDDYIRKAIQSRILGQHPPPPPAAG